MKIELSPKSIKFLVQVCEQRLEGAKRASNHCKIMGKSKDSIDHYDKWVKIWQTAEDELKQTHKNKWEKATLFLMKNPQLYRHWAGKNFRFDMTWKVIAQLLKREGYYSAATYWQDIKVYRLVKDARARIKIRK